MARGKSIGLTVAAVLTAAAVAGGVAYGVGQLGTPDGIDPDPVVAALPTIDPVIETPSPAPIETPTATPTPTETPTPTATPTPEARYALGDAGDGVRELQSRLKQIQWYEPKITGEFDDVTLQSVEGFQAKRGFEVTGQVDDETWDRLLQMTRMPTDDEMHNRIVAGPTILGPDDSGDRVRELQARLKQIGWFDQDVTATYGPVTATAVSGFQTKRGVPSTGEVDQRTWDLLVGMSRKPSDDEMHNRRPEPPANASGLPSKCATGRVLCIDKTSRSLRWVIDGSVKLTLDARFGSELTPTREGTFDVYWKSRDHHSSLFDTPMPYAMFFDGGQAIHYSPDFAASGYNGSSHGCVNIRDKGAIASLFDQVRNGDKVYVYRS